MTSSSCQQLQRDHLTPRLSRQLQPVTSSLALTTSAFSIKPRDINLASHTPYQTFQCLSLALRHLLFTFCNNPPQVHCSCNPYILLAETVHQKLILHHHRQNDALLQSCTCMSLFLLEFCRSGASAPNPSKPTSSGRCCTTCPSRH